MRKTGYITVSAAALALAAACALGGCSGGTAATETTAAVGAAETTAAAESQAGQSQAGQTAETTAAELTGDAKLIAEIDPVMPDLGKVTHGDFSSISITAPLAQPITDEDVNTYIEEYVLAGQTREVDEAAKDGDTVNIDFVGKLNGEAFEGGTGEAYDLTLGSGTFIEGFEEGLLGTKAGDTRSLNLTFPKDYNAEDLAGKDVVFEVKVNSVKRPMKAADLTDELANQFSAGTYPTAKEYVDGVRDALELSASAIAKGELFNNAIVAAAGLSETAVSDAAVDWQIDLYLQNYDKTLKSSYGFGLSDLLGMYGQDYTGFRATLEEGAKESAKTAAVVEAIAKENGLEYNEETLKQYLEEYGYEEDLVRQNSSDAWLEQTVKQYLVAKYLVDQADVRYISYEDYEAEALAKAEAEAKAAETEQETAGAEKESAAK